MNNIHEEIVSCPYNKSHRIPSSKFQRHLVKCEKNFPPDYKVICPYNATHRFSKSEIKEHIDTCPMRWTVEGSYILYLNLSFGHREQTITANVQLFAL
ncbi:gametocyte-specific factor 1-like [Solenopsis invicta]|uniref:gametocyte-specific factor 1-like n=1 Tax=Solenopsis invicta TaxID=13686 RepID=UPI00193E1873|nr:gametocyte-specific factor 1-like [Solenopsis invicta]